MINSDRYFEELPEDFELLLEALGSEIRFMISVILIEEGDLSFSKITALINKEKSNVLNHLKKLELGGIIQNYIKKSEISREFSFYQITKYGNKIIKELISFYNNYYKRIDNSNKMMLSNKKEIPEEFVYLLKAISNEFRFKLALLLLKKVRLSFSEITHLTQIDNSLVKSHLNKLEIGGIIKNYFEKSAATKEYSFYTLTNFGKELVLNLIESYNNYYSVYDELAREIPTLTSESSTEIPISTSESSTEIPSRDFIEGGCGSWALPNEKILAWIKILSNKVFKIVINCSKNLKIVEFYHNIKSEYNNKVNSYSILFNEKKYNYLSYELRSEIPDNDNPINLEKLVILAYDKDDNILTEKELVIEIIKPVLKLKVIEEPLTENSGYFKINITFSTDIQIAILGIQVDVTDEDNNPVKIDEEKIDPLYLEQELPPEIDLEKVLGGFKLYRKGVFNFHFKVPYKDVLGNEYFSNIEIITLKNPKEFEYNLNYNYQYEKDLALAGD